jgi:hypothetical protein
MHRMSGNRANRTERGAGFRRWLSTVCALLIAATLALPSWARADTLQIGRASSETGHVAVMAGTSSRGIRAWGGVRNVLGRGARATARVQPVEDAAEDSRGSVYGRTPGTIGGGRGQAVSVVHRALPSGRATTRVRGGPGAVVGAGARDDDGHGLEHATAHSETGNATAYAVTDGDMHRVRASAVRGRVGVRSGHHLLRAEGERVQVLSQSHADAQTVRATVVGPGRVELQGPQPRTLDVAAGQRAVLSSSRRGEVTRLSVQIHGEPIASEAPAATAITPPGPEQPAAAEQPTQSRMRDMMSRVGRAFRRPFAFMRRRSSEE